MLRIRLYNDPEVPREWRSQGEAKRYGARRPVKIARGRWIDFPIRDYLSRLAKLSPRTLGDVELTLHDGTALSGAEALAYIARFRS